MGESVRGHPDSDAQSGLNHRSEFPKYVATADIIWIAAFLCVVIINIWFGVHNYGEAKKVAEIKANAERLLHWVSEKGPLREKGQEVLSGCNDPKGLWQDCLAALIIPGGPFESFKNHLEPQGQIFSDSCDRGDLKTLGSIVIERGTAKPLDPSSMTYSKMPASQDLSGRLPLKIFICGRSFHPMNVGEAIF
ncbi:MAG: hypothetical protein EBR85_07915 [Betaproteobacteria bacterium]|nr:hypothetical protein [Betaproteobacteria bacterium]